MKKRRGYQLIGLADGDTPDIGRVFGNGAVGREPADAGGVEDLARHHAAGSRQSRSTLSWAAT